MFNQALTNDDWMTGFVRKNGYTVLNPVEIIKPYRGKGFFTET